MQQLTISLPQVLIYEESAIKASKKSNAGLRTKIECTKKGEEGEALIGKGKTRIFRLNPSSAECPDSYKRVRTDPTSEKAKVEMEIRERRLQTVG